MVTAVQTPPTAMTSVAFEERYGEDDRVELWRGVVVEMSPVEPTHNKIAYRLSAILSTYTMRTGIGEIWPGDAGLTIEREPDTVVSPDMTFVPAEAARGMTDDEPGFPFFVPPLVVEIKSPSDSEREITAKLSLYYTAGVAEIWWVRPRQRTLTRHWADRDPVVLRPGDTLGDVEALPGFSMRVDDIFPPEPPSAQEGDS